MLLVNATADTAIILSFNIILAMGHRLEHVEGGQILIEDWIHMRQLHVNARAEIDKSRSEASRTKRGRSHIKKV